MIPFEQLVFLLHSEVQDGFAERACRIADRKGLNVYDVVHRAIELGLSALENEPTAQDIGMRGGLDRMVGVVGPG